jgi:EAL domain-containing protein (putative c-di-GMP-specific phosphodiesterase class I)
VQTIAQYVESAPTLTLLRKFDIDFAQGYGISKPVPWPKPRSVDSRSPEKRDQSDLIHQSERT